MLREDKLACFTPNDERMDNIVRMARELKADGVIHYALQFCQPYTPSKPSG